MHYKGGKRCCQPSGIFQPRSMSCCRKFPPGNGENYDGNSDDDGDDNNNEHSGKILSSMKVLCRVIAGTFTASAGITQVTRSAVRF